MLVNAILFILSADPTALPLWAVVLFSAAFYPLGLLFAVSGCDKCVRVRCHLDPRGYWNATQFDEELGYALGDERTTKCRKACNNTSSYKLPTYIEGDRDVTMPKSQCGKCTDFLANAVPDWEQHYHCQEDSPATQLEITLSGAVAATAPSGDALEAEIQAGYDSFRDAINATVIFDLDCEGNGGCVPMASPISICNVSYPFGTNRYVTRTQVQPVMTAFVGMRKIDGVDASGFRFQVMTIAERYYYSNTSPSGTVVEEASELPLDEVPQNDPDEEGYVGALAGEYFFLTDANGARGCAKRPSAGRSVSALSPLNSNWDFSADFGYRVDLTVYGPDAPVPEAISKDGCFHEPAECAGRTFTRDPYIGGNFNGAPGSDGVFVESQTLGLLDGSSAISWEASLS